MRLVQWNKDVESYGDKAIELWAYKPENSQEWRNCTQGINPSWNAQQFEYRRKESAALPFDLERAKAGDIVEILMIDGKWESNCQLEYVIYLCENPGHDRKTAETHLRMKCPPKANNGTK